MIIKVKKKSVILFILVLLVILSFFLFFTLKKTQSRTELSKEELKYISENKVVHFVGQMNYAPFEFIDKNGDYNGMMIDLLRWISYEFGFKIRFTPTTFKDAQKMVIEGKADGISSLFYSEKREANFDFSYPVFQVPASIFVYNKRFDISSLKDLNGKKIGMQAGDYAEEFLKENNIDCQIIYVDDFYKAIDKIVENEVDAVIGDEQVVWYHIFSMNYTDKIKVIGDPLYIGLNCFGLNKNNKILLSILNKGIEKAKDQGILDKLTKKWIGLSYKPIETESIDIKTLKLINIFISIIILILIILLIQNINKSQVIKESSEQLLRIIIDSIPFIVYLTDKNQNIIEFNKEFAKFFKLPIFSNKVKSTRKISYNEIFDFIPSNMQEQFKQLSFDDKEINKDLEILNNEGEKRLFNIEKITIESPISNEKMVLTLAKDITELKKTEEEILKIQKLESVGLLAGKIAHDFNNVLTGIIGNLSLAQVYIDNKEELKELLSSAKDVSIHAKTITSQLLAFSKGGAPIKELVDPLEVIKSVLDFSLKGTSIEYELNILSNDRFYIYADKNQYFQAINNIIINAMQANSENGKIVLNLEYKELENFNDEKINKKFYCIVSIEDEGPGIPPEIANKIFNPFFTTKSSGTGLGLSSVKTICNNHSGYVFFKNKEKKGAIFYLLFPSTYERIIQKGKENEQEKNIKKFSIIILDDDDVVLNTAKKVFWYFNCDIYCCKNSNELFETLENRKFDICILDLVVPGSLGGEQIVKILKEKYPKMIYIVSSGYASNPVMANYQRYGFDYVLKKPYDFGDVKNILKKIESNL